MTPRPNRRSDRGAFRSLVAIAVLAMIGAAPPAHAQATRAAPAESADASSELMDGDVLRAIGLALQAGGIGGLQDLVALTPELEERIQRRLADLIEASVGAGGSAADVTLRVSVDPTILDGEAVRFDSLVLDFGREMALSRPQLDALAVGDTLTTYVGALPAAMGAVRVLVRGARNGSNVTSESGIRLAIAPETSPVIRIVLEAGPDGGWRARPELEANPPRPEAIDAGAAGAPASGTASLHPALATALDEFLAARYELVRDRVSLLLDGATAGDPATATELDGDERAAALWLRAAASSRTGHEGDFRRALTELRRTAPDSPYRALAEVEALGSHPGQLDDTGSGTASLSESDVPGLPAAAALLTAERMSSASDSLRASLFEAGSRGPGLAGAVAAYRAGSLWSAMGRPAEAAAAYERARAGGGELARLARVGQAEATLNAGDPEKALEILQGYPAGETASQRSGDPSSRPDTATTPTAGGRAERLPEGLPPASLARADMTVGLVRSRALARLGRVEEAVSALRAAGEAAPDELQRAEAEILLADLLLISGDTRGAQARFAGIRTSLEDRPPLAAASDRQPSGTSASQRGVPSDAGSIEGAVDLSYLAHRWADRATARMVRSRDGNASDDAPTESDAAEGDGGLAGSLALVEAPGPAEGAVRGAMWVGVDARLDLARVELLGSARAAAAERALGRLGSSPTEGQAAALSTANARAYERLGQVADPRAPEALDRFRRVIAPLEAAVARGLELATLLTDARRPAVDADAPLVTTRTDRGLEGLSALRSRTHRLLEADLELVELQIEMARTDDPEARGRLAVEIARRLRALRQALEEEGGSYSATGAVGSGRAPTADDLERFSRLATSLASRGEAGLVGASGDEAASFIESLRRTERAARRGDVSRESAVRALREELDAALSAAEEGREAALAPVRQAGEALERALQLRDQAVGDRSRTAEDRLRARTAAVLEMSRFGEASAAFFAALDAPEDEAPRLLAEAEALHGAFYADYPDSPLTPTVALQLAEIQVRSADLRFASGLRGGSGGAPGSAEARPDYGDAIAGLRAAMDRMEGEERMVAQQTLGYLLFQNGDFEEAVEILGRYVGRLDESDPRRGEALFRLGDAMFAAAMERTGENRRGSLQDAAVRFAGAARSSTAGSETELLALYKLGWSRYLLDDYEAATEAFGALMDRYADLAADGSEAVDLGDEVLRYATVSLSQLDQPVRRAARFASARAPEYEYATYRGLAETLAEQGRLPDALAVFEAFRNRSPLAPEALAAQQRRIEIYESRLGDQPRAQQARLELVRFFGPQSEWWSANPGERARAEAAVSDALRKAAHHRMAAAEEAGDARLFGEAGSLYHRFVELFPASDSTRTLQFMAGEAYWEAGAFLEAGAAYEAAAYDFGGSFERAKTSALNAIAAYSQPLQDGADDASPDPRPVDAERAARLLDGAVDRFVERYPDADEAPEALRLRAGVASEREDLRAAERYGELIERYPDSPQAAEARKLLGDIAFRQGEVRAALRSWESAESSARDAGLDALAADVSDLRAEATLSVADSLAAADQLEDAAGFYQMFARNHPQDERAPSAYDNAVAAWVESGRPEEAIATLDERLDRYPEDETASEAAIRRAELLREVGRIEEAVNQYERIHDTHPDRERRPEILLRIAELHAEEGDSVRAAQAYDRFQRVYPDDPRAADALFAAARGFHEEEDPGRADELYREYLDRFPSSARSLAAAAELFRLRSEERTGSVVAARERLLEVAADASPEQVASHGAMLGRAHLEVAAELFEAYERLRLAPAQLTEQALLSERARKDRALEEVSGHLESAIGTGDPEAVSRGLYLMGAAYAEYARYIDEMELPDGTPAAVEEAVRRQSRGVVDSYDDRARAQWSRLLSLAGDNPEMDLEPDREGLQNPWVDRAREEVRSRLGEALVEDLRPRIITGVPDPRFVTPDRIPDRRIP